MKLKNTRSAFVFLFLFFFNNFTLNAQGLPPSYLLGEPFPCGNEMYIVNGTTLYIYHQNGTQEELFEVGNINAIGFSKDGYLWAFKQGPDSKSVVAIDAEGNIFPALIPGLPKDLID